MYYLIDGRWVLQDTDIKTADQYRDRYRHDVQLSTTDAAKILAADPLPPAAVPAEVLTESTLPAPRGDGAGGGK